LRVDSESPIETADNHKAEKDQQRAQCNFGPFAARDQPSALSRQRLSRSEPDADQRRGRADPENDHGQGHLSRGLSLRREHGSGAKRRADAGTPYRAEQQAYGELTCRSVRLHGAGAMVGPVADGAASRRQAHLQRRHGEHDPNANHQNGADVAEDVAVKPNGEADGRDEKTDGDERKNNARGERRRAHSVLDRRCAEHDRQ
jgi:hypothetical protein